MLVCDVRLKETWTIHHRWEKDKKKKEMFNCFLPVYNTTFLTRMLVSVILHREYLSAMVVPSKDFDFQRYFIWQVIFQRKLWLSLTMSSYIGLSVKIPGMWRLKWNTSSSCDKLTSINCQADTTSPIIPERAHRKLVYNGTVDIALFAKKTFFRCRMGDTHRKHAPLPFPT